MPSYQRVNEVPLPQAVHTTLEIPDSRSSSPNEIKGKFLKYGIISLFAFLGFAVALSMSSAPIQSNPVLKSSHSHSTEEAAEFDELGRYVMTDYDTKKPFSDFLAGLGGIWGIPMWTFYVNRGQGVTAFGIQNKDGAIAKFNTAEKAYQQTAFTGFRTFVKCLRNGREWTAMPFYPQGPDPNEYKPERKMKIGMNEMEIEEVDLQNELQTNVLYFTVPNEDFPALVRKTTFKNIGTKQPLHIEVLDGLGKLIPSGLSNGALDGIGRTMEAWMNVYNLGTDEITQPFFHISQGTADTALVQVIKDGHFVVAYEEGHPEKLLPFVVDPSLVFGFDTTLTNPSEFFNSELPIETIVKQPQGTSSRTPCSFAAFSKTIPVGGSVTIISIYGHAPTLENYLGTVTPVLLKNSFVATKYKEATELAQQLTSKVATKTSSSIFNAYIRQSYLDNFLRGGLPVLLGDPANPKVYHVYSRIHGDLERDYNFYQLDTTYYSQGPGNFRDVNQNRRVDVLLNPSVGDFNIRMFLSFVQADGYNPLTVASTFFRVPESALASLIATIGLSTVDGAALATIIRKPFRPGQLFADLAKAGVAVPIADRQKFLDKVIAVAEQSAAGQYAQNGYWADHWTYTLDLVDNYLAVFPDKEASLLYDSEPIPFFMSPAIVKSRADRYNLYPKDLAKPNDLVLRVFGAVAQWGEKEFPSARIGAMTQIFVDPAYIGENPGAGGVWQRNADGTTATVSPLAKLAILGILKFSTLDPLGMGVEMEGGKPGWNDAMNGLPGLLGSGMPETYEFLRILRYVKSALDKYHRPVVFPEEFSTLVLFIQKALNYLPSQPDEDVDLIFWNAANDAREAYRAATVAVFSGKTVTWGAEDLSNVIGTMISKTEAGIAKALATSPSGISPTYFYYECSDFKVVIPPNLNPVAGATPPGNLLKANTFNLHTLPLFLEGPVRHLKTLTTVAEKREVYQKTKASPLYDSALKMFFISDSLAPMGQDVGRMKAFSPGWLENQSIWLHMSYKWYLELLRGGLYEEFFEELKTGLVPFMDSDVYGRSPIQAASFIVSSAFPDKKLHGASFAARLSGSTAEFLSMWAILFFGEKPFGIDPVSGQVQLQLKPVLPGWLFKEDDNTVSSTFLGSVKVTYHNPKRVDTWTTVPKSGSAETVDGHTITSSNGVFIGHIAELVRTQKITSIDIHF